jgi:hypothetical protein
MTVANYDDITKTFQAIPASEKKEYVINQNTNRTIDLNSGIFSDGFYKRYLKYRLDIIQSISYAMIEKIAFTHKSPINYISEPLRISNDNPIKWLTFQCEWIDGGTGLAAPIFYLRSADTAKAIDSATWYRVYKDTQISNLPLRKVIQFKVEFVVNSEHRVQSLTINYITNETDVYPCAITWKSKYILNMNSGNGTGDLNDVIYAYDKDGYWVKKDGETNSIYFKGIDKMFGGDNANGIIWHKDEGYENDGETYECYFITKKFRLTDIENIFRFIKLLYKSAVPIFYSYSVDDGEFIEIELEPTPTDTGDETGEHRLNDIRDTLSGIVSGQTIQLRFAWNSNEITEIHRVELLWQALRELNRR